MTPAKDGVLRLSDGVRTVEVAYTDMVMKAEPITLALPSPDMFKGWSDVMVASVRLDRITGMQEWMRHLYVNAGYPWQRRAKKRWWAQQRQGRRVRS